MAQLDKIRLSGTTYDLVDATAIHSLDGYYTTGETNAAITAATDALAQAIAEQNYATTGYVQEAIAEASGVTTGQVQTMIDNSISGKVDTNTYTAYTAATDTALEGKADVSDIPSVTGYADSVQYNTTSKYVEFYHGGTGGTKVYEFDASPFLIDGMVESVVITSITSGASEVTVLEITWNSAAGGQVTDIPLSEIFDASNYYTKSEVDTALGNKVDTSVYTAYTAATDTAIGNKADTTAVTQSITEATSGKVDSNTYTAYTAATDTALAGKQATLVNQENIKSINGNSLLGSGDLTVDTGLHAEVSGTTLIFQ